MLTLKSLIQEYDIKLPIVWLGIVDAYGSVDAKRFAPKTKKEAGNVPGHDELFDNYSSTWRFVEDRDTVYWWRSPTEDEQNLVSNFLENRGFPDVSHLTYGQDTSADALSHWLNEQKIIGAKDTEPGIPRENGGYTSLILKDGTAIVGEKIHPLNYNKALELGIATEEQLNNAMAGFTRKDGKSWDVNGDPIKVSNIIWIDDIEKSNNLTEQEEHKLAYHLTFKSLLPKIKKEGLIPQHPKDMPDMKAVYLFKTRDDFENAWMNWLGARIDDEEVNEKIKLHPLLLTVDITGLKCIDTVEFEWACLDTIPPNRIVKIEDI